MDHAITQVALFLQRSTQCTCEDEPAFIVAVDLDNTSGPSRRRLCEMAGERCCLNPDSPGKIDRVSARRRQHGQVGVGKDTRYFMLLAELVHGSPTAFTNAAE
jgi:hypothetical protein